MAKCRNCITVFNAGTTMIEPYSPVEIGRRIDASGLSDDYCFEVVPAKPASKMIGITDCPVMPGMPGRAVISGIASARIAGFFDSGDLISPNGSGSWQTAKSGQVTVISPADDHGIGTVLLSPVQKPAVSGAYEGHFCVKDTSTDEKLMVLVEGGETDIGTVASANFEITQSCTIFVVAQYSEDENGRGKYEIFITNDRYNDDRITGSNVGEWVVANVYLTDGTMTIIQQWQNGVIYFGTRYWVK